MVNDVKINGFYLGMALVWSLILIHSMFMPHTEIHSLIWFFVGGFFVIFNMYFAFEDNTEKKKE